MFLFLSYLYFCPEFFGHVEKRLDRKAKVFFSKFMMPSTGNNNYNIHIAKYLKKYWHTDNENWSVNGT